MIRHQFLILVTLFMWVTVLNAQGPGKDIDIDADLTVENSKNDGDGDSSADLFGMEINYNEGGQVAQYNGNISAQRWKTSKLSVQNVAPPKMGYQYKYDELDRMLEAKSEMNGVIDNAHNELLSYDINGNIGTLERSAFVNNSIN